MRVVSPSLSLSAQQASARFLASSPLPVLSSLDDLRRALGEAGRAVLAAPPGSGKTTAVPLALLNEPWLQGQKILVLEPRRVAARAAAARMASLLGEAPGGTVGYQIRFERKISAQTRIEVITEGLLTRRLHADPDLPGVGLVIFDEFHERSLDADLGLALTLDARANLRPELRVLVMSATLDTTRVSALLDEAPVVSSAGQLFPIDIRYAPPDSSLDLGENVARCVLRALQETAGDILAFLPGSREIRGAQSSLRARFGERIAIRPLMGELSSADQDLALRPDRDGRRKVILATNIAQTSLTVEGVSTVVDGGWVRVARFDLGAGSNRLETQRVSRASADQRAGRAGRLGPGSCYRLWTQEQHGLLAAHDTAEIEAVDLSGFALDIAAWGSDPASLHLLDPPPETRWRYAVDRLQELGALDAEARITAHGRSLVMLPAAPRRANMLRVAQQQGLAPIAAWVAASLDEREHGAALDLATRVERYRKGTGDPAAVRRVRESAQQLLRQLGCKDAGDTDETAVAHAIAWAFPERLARRREGVRHGRQVTYLCADGGEACLDEHEPLAQSPWLAIAHWEPGTPRRIRLAASIKEAELYERHSDRLAWQDVVHWDRNSEVVVAESQRRLGAIVLERRNSPEKSSAAVARAMLSGVRSMGLDCLPWTEALRQWQQRVLSIRHWRPDEEWPDVSDEALLQSIETWLMPFISGVSRRAHLSQLNLSHAMDSLLSAEQRHVLSALAPTHVSVPTGSRICLEYKAGHAPSLAVKLQELFGCTSTPSVNGGRTSVILHLLSPGQRPIAVTSDLAGFWRGAYADVRKDLRGRYPRHPWPEDPVSALPTRRAKPRGT